MDFYERKRRAGIDLAQWIKNDKRDEFDTFSRRMLSAYGFDKTNMLKMIQKNYNLTVTKNNKLTKVE